MDPPGVVGIGPFGQPAAPELGRGLAAAARPARPCQRATPAPPSTTARSSASRPSVIVWRPCARLPSMPMRMSLNSLTLVSLSPSGRRVEDAEAGRAALDRLPGGRRGAVVQHRLAHDLHLDLALQALDHAHQQVVGVVVGRRPRVARAALVVVPGADRQRVEHAHPPLGRHPGRLDHVRARQVAASGRARRRRMGRPSSCPHRGRAEPRTPTASRSGAGTSTRSSLRR